MKVFISYRRSDTSGYALLLKRSLPELLPGVDVFLDQHDTPPGIDFRRHLAAQLTGAAVVLVIIGDEWAVDRAGNRRIMEPGDLVGWELRKAMRERTPPAHVLPILVEGAAMPTKGDLPADLDALAYLQAIRVTDQHFDRDLAELAEAIRRAVDPPPSPPATSSSPPRPSAAPPGSSPSIDTDCEQRVPAMPFSEVVALVSQLRRDGVPEAEIEAKVLARTPFAAEAAIPAKVTRKWLDRNAPLLPAAGLAKLVGELLARRWTPKQIEEDVLGRIEVLPRIDFPKKITIPWLERHALLLPDEQRRELADLMHTRGWDPSDIEWYLGLI